MPTLTQRLRVWRRRTLIGLAGFCGALVLIVLAGLAMPGCAVGYVTRQSATHLRVLAARQPLRKAIANGRIPEEWLAKIAVIRAARNFGVEHLGLPAEDLYRSISLVRPGPMWVVTACPKDALDPVTWWFPVAGRVAYRGYYDRDDAERFAGKLRRRDLDVLVQASDAFSSLGWFSDPIRPAMLQRRETSLANLVLHEAAHRVVYYKGQTDFNESFAAFVGDEGTVEFLAHTEGPECRRCLEVRRSYSDAGVFSAFVGSVVQDLEALYGEPISRQAKIEQREQVFAAARTRFATLPLAADGYSWFPARQLDNAVMLSLRRYEGRRELFDRLLSACGGDLGRAVAAVEELRWNRLRRARRRAESPFDLLQHRLDAGIACPGPAKTRVPP